MGERILPTYTITDRLAAVLTDIERARGFLEAALQLAALREEQGLSQKELAKRVGTTQQQISRLESPSYEGHSLSMLRRVAEALGAQVHVTLDVARSQRLTAAEARARYGSAKP